MADKSKLYEKLNINVSFHKINNDYYNTQTEYEKQKHIETFF